jgi:hypothetical protein
MSRVEAGVWGGQEMQEALGRCARSVGVRRVSGGLAERWGVVLAVAARRRSSRACLVWRTSRRVRIIRSESAEVRERLMA